MFTTSQSVLFGVGLVLGVAHRFRKTLGMMNCTIKTSHSHDWPFAVGMLLRTARPSYTVFMFPSSTQLANSIVSSFLSERTAPIAVDTWCQGATLSCMTNGGSFITARIQLS
jgi:hypothetical protein